MIAGLNRQKPEFTVQNGAIRLSSAKAISDEKGTFLLNGNDIALTEFPNDRLDGVPVDVSQAEYQAAEGLTAEMLTYLPGEDVLDFDACSQEHLAMVIQKWCAEKNRPTVQSVDSHYEEFLRDERLAELRKACQNAIDEGVEVATSEGVKKFSLTMHDQINLMGLRNLLDKGCLTIPYHADGEAIQLWSRDDVQKILQEADRHITYHRVYHSLLREWISRMSYPDFLGIDYDDALPDDLAKKMAEVLVGIVDDTVPQR